MAISETAYRIAKHLLAYPSARRIQDITHDLVPAIPAASAYKVVRWMKYHGAVVERNRLYSVDLRRLLDLLAATRVSNLLPTRVLTSPLDPPALHARLQEARLDHVFAFSTAASLTAFFEPLENLQVYVEKGATRRVSEVVGEGKIEVEVFEDRLETVPRQTSADGLPITELLRTAIDVRSHPRGGAYATILQDALSKEAGY